MTEANQTAETPDRNPPVTYSPEIANIICARIAEGQPVTKIVKNPDMPSQATIYQWLKDKPEFAESYARARKDQADTLASEILEIADEKVDGSDQAQRQKLRVDARKWIASKLKPKVYGDRHEIDLTVKDKTAVLTGEERALLQVETLKEIGQAKRITEG